jgi:phosphate-selective porin OprO/OprP
MIKIKTIVILAVAVVISIGANAQENTISGVVTSSEDGAPVTEVDIRLKGALEISSKTDKSGKYNISIPSNSSNILIFTHENYDLSEVSVLGKSVVDVQMVSAVRRNQYGQIVERQELSAESREGFIVFESKDKNYKLWFDNRVYLDGAYYFDNYDKNKTADENLAEGNLDIPGQLLKLRRMRFAIKANVGDNWYGEIDFDFDGNTVDIKDAYIRKYFGPTGSPWGQFRIGQFRMPQGMQTTTTSRYLKLMERASVGEFNTNRKLGIGWNSWSEKYSFGIGLHTEEIRNIHTQLEGEPNYYKGSFDEDVASNEGIMQGAEPMLGVSSRGTYYIKNETGKLISIGLGYSARTPGLYKYPDLRIKYDPKDETNVSEMEFTVAKVGGVELAHNMNIDAAVSFGPWRMTGEYYYNMLTMESGADPVNFSGFYVQSAYLLTGENHPWNYREAEFTKIKANDKSGAWEVAARYSYINLNDFNSGVRGGQKGQITVGLNYYASNNVKFMINYSYVDHDRYSDGSGDYAAIVNPGFYPTGYDYSFLAWRCEIDF